MLRIRRTVFNYMTYGMEVDESKSIRCIHLLAYNNIVYDADKLKHQGQASTFRTMLHIIPVLFYNNHLISILRAATVCVREITRNQFSVLAYVIKG